LPEVVSNSGLSCNFEIVTFAFYCDVVQCLLYVMVDTDFLMEVKDALLFRSCYMHIISRTLKPIQLNCSSSII